MNSLPPTPADSEDAGTPIRPIEVEYALKRTKSKSAPGADGISYHVLKAVSSILSPWLADLFEWCRSRGVVLNEWKTGITTLLYKKGDETAPQNWRPITLLSCLSKLYSSVIDKRIHRYDRALADMQKNRLFSMSQRGFRPGLEGTHFNTEILKNAQELAPQLYAVYIDFSNAFGSMDHAVFFEVLKLLRIPRYIQRYLKASYSGASFRVKLGERSFTAPIVLTRGCPQGKPCSPTAFALFADVLLRHLELISTNHGLPYSPTSLASPTYADDVGLLAPTKDQMKEKLVALLQFSHHTNIMVNIDKCTAQGYTRSGNVVTQHTAEFKLDGKQIPTSLEPFKYLGQSEVMSVPSASR